MKTLTKVSAQMLVALSSLTGIAHADDAVLKKIHDSGAITIGYRETAAPFSYLDTKGGPSGYSIDLCKKIAASAQAALKLPSIKINFVPVSPQTRIPLLSNGTIDIECATTVNTLSRQQQVDFSYAIALSEGRMLVRKDSNIKSFGDLNGKIIALANGTTAERYVQTALASAKINARILNVRDNAEGLIAVSSKRADTFINDAVLLGSVLKTAPNAADFQVIGKPMSFEQVALMVPKNNSGFLAIVNATIARSLANGSLQKSYTTWVAPYGAPIEGETETLFKVEAVED
jgi:glutamate/aspartate transport system substrate-binding protein